MAELPMPAAQRSNVGAFIHRRVTGLGGPLT